MHVAAHLSSSGSLAAYFIDRVLPSLISGFIVLLAGFLLNRSIRTHVDRTTQAQTVHLAEHLKAVTHAQTEHLAQLNAAQTETLSARAAAPRPRPSRTKKPAPAGDGSAKAGSPG